MIPYIKHIYYIPGKFYNTAFSIMMNQKKWDSLSKDVQTAIESKEGLNIARHAKAWDDNSTEAKPQFKAAGINYAPASEKLVAEMRK